MKHDKASIQKGMFMMRDGPGRAAIKYSAPPPPPKYGAPPSFKQVNEQLDDAMHRLEKLREQMREQVRNARR